MAYRRISMVVVSRLYLRLTVLILTYKCYPNTVESCLILLRAGERVIAFSFSTSIFKMRWEGDSLCRVRFIVGKVREPEDYRHLAGQELGAAYVMDPSALASGASAQHQLADILCARYHGRNGPMLFL